MGAKISGIGSNLLTIEGVESLGGTEHTMLPDMIEIGSWIGLAAMTKSELTIKNVSWDDLGQIPNAFQKLGIKLERKGDDIYIPKHENGYEVQKLHRWFHINNSGCALAGTDPRFIEYSIGGFHSGQGRSSHSPENV